MTKEDIQTAIEKIIASAGDDEKQHSQEDQLRFEFIQFVGEQCLGELSEMAELVLSTNDLDFNRWCA